MLAAVGSQARMIKYKLVYWRTKTLLEAVAGVLQQMPARAGRCQPVPWPAAQAAADGVLRKNTKQHTLCS